MKWRYTSDYKPTIILAFLLFISLGLVSLNITKEIQTIKHFMYYIFNPTPELAMKIIDNGKYLTENLLSVVRLKDENRYLKQQVNRLAYLEKKYVDVVDENKRLREMLDLKKSVSYDLISARTISRDPFNWFRAVTIDKGKRDGIGADLPVITFVDSQEALVGRTVSVSKSTSKVLLITDRLSAVPAMVVRSGDYGLIQGDNHEEIILDYLLQDSLAEIGDEIMTSGIGEIFPSGISIGIVVEIYSEKEKYFKQAIIKPKIQLSRIKEVFIIKRK